MAAARLSPLEWPTPAVDRELFLAQGFLIVDCIPPEHLDPLRSSFEALVDRQRAEWRAQGNNTWEKSAQPRLPAFDRLVDGEHTAFAMEFCLGSTTRGVCKELMQADDAANVAFFLMCSPQEDHGPAHWHRDIHPIDQGPLQGLRQDMLDNQVRSALFREGSEFYRMRMWSINASATTKWLDEKCPSRAGAGSWLPPMEHLIV